MSSPTVALRLASVGIHLLVAMLIGYFGGHWIDGKFGTEIWGPILGFLGIVAGFHNLFRELAIVNRAEEAQRLEDEAHQDGTEKKDSNQ